MDRTRTIGRALTRLLVLIGLITFVGPLSAQADIATDIQSGMTPAQAVKKAVEEGMDPLEAALAALAIAPDAAAEIAAAVAAAVPGQAAEIAAAVAAAVPGQAAEIAAAVATAVPGQAAEIAAAVATAVPGQAAEIAAAVSAVVPAATQEITQAVQATQTPSQPEVAGTPGEQPPSAEGFEPATETTIQDTISESTQEPPAVTNDNVPASAT